ncbi:MAG: hypothetical protein ACYCYA_11645 [Actinomycetes bacterium]
MTVPTRPDVPSVATIPVLAGHRGLGRLAVGLLGLVTVDWLGAWLVVGPGVPRGTRVLGVDIGGMNRLAAEQRSGQAVSGRLA